MLKWLFKNKNKNKNKTNNKGEFNMIPTIGRIVYYKDLNGETNAAIVSKVNSETNLGLHVFYPNLQPHYLNSVEQGTDNGTWDWMPYQKEQSAKQSQTNE